MYLNMDCKKCGRHRVEQNYICEKCGYFQLEEQILQLVHWIYVKDELPQTKDGSSVGLTCSAIENGVEFIVTAMYIEEENIWLDMDLHQRDVYAWLKITPAPYTAPLDRLGVM